MCPTWLCPLDESLGALGTRIHPFYPRDGNELQAGRQLTGSESATGGDTDPCSGGQGMVCANHPGAVCLCLMISCSCFH